MSIATTTRRLQAEWNRTERRNSPWPRWAETHPELAGAPEAIKQNLTRPERHIARPPLAALVALATHGDRDAALLATLSCLPMVASSAAQSNVRTQDAGDQLASCLCYAIMTTQNPNIPTLRETLRRATWRRFWADQRRDPYLLDATTGTVIRGTEHLTPVDVTDAHVPHKTTLEDETFPTVNVTLILDELTRAGKIGQQARRTVEHIADGTINPHQSPDTFQQAVRRTAPRLRTIPGLYEAITA